MWTCGGLRNCIRTLLPPAAALVAPAEDRRVRLLRPEPGFGAVRTGAGRIVRDLLAAENALLAGKMPGLPDDAGTWPWCRTSLDSSVPTSSFTGSFMCQTLR